MLKNNNENKIHLLLKLGPISLVLVSVFIFYYLYTSNNSKFEEELEKIKKETVLQKNIQVKKEVQNVYELIEYEKNQAEKELKRNIKKNVYEAHTIAMSIYKNNKNKSKLEITKMIKDALREMRFNNGRGYFFIYDFEGTNIMHPILEKLEGKNLINLQDKEGSYIIQKLINLVNEKKEGFQRWWWTKPNDKFNQYQKIGFSKHFKPLNYLIGTGEYIIDWEEELKKKILPRIERMYYGKNGYIFISDYKGTILSHINQDFTEKNKLNINDKKGFSPIKEMIDIAKNGEGFLSYVATSQPSTGKQLEKKSFIKGYQDWNWLIGSGFYIDDINKDIKTRQAKFHKENENHLAHILTINTLIFGILFLFSLYISYAIKKRFEEYKEKVEKQREELLVFNNNLENEVKNRTAQYQRATLDAQSANRAKSAFLANMSHEIRTPLNAILGFVNILKDNETDKEKSKYLQTISASSNSLLTLISDILDFAKVESGNMTLDIVNVNPHLDFGNIGSLFFAKAEDMNLKFNLYIDPNLPKNIKIDSLKIRQVLTNLLSNAMKFSSKEEIVTLKIKYNKEDTSIFFSVSDTGIGIAKENYEKIFQLFSQEEDSTSSKYGGTGLGLAISSKIVELMGSKLEIKSEVGKGSEFYFNLCVELSDNNEDHFSLSSDIKNISIGLLCDRNGMEQLNTLTEYLNSFGINDISLLKNKEEVALLKYPLIIINSDMYSNKEIQLFLDNGHAVIIIKTSLSKNFSNNFKGKVLIIDPPFNPSSLYDGLLEVFRERKEENLELDSSNTIEGNYNKNANILIAEDNKPNQLFMKVIMKKLGLNFSFAHDGVEAINMFKNNKYDLILMDENMPNMNGIESTRNILQIEKEEDLIHTPIIALTANAIKGDRERFLEVGMDEYLSKPLVLSDLVKILTHFLPNVES